MENPYAPFVTPPGPFVLVRIGPSAGTPASDSQLAQLDCGADRTVVTSELVQQLQLVPSGLALVAGLGGEVEESPLYDVSLTLAGFQPLSVEVFASEGEPWVLLGRDVLNRYRIVLDGPNQTLEIT
jgi:Aspartyl protease